MCHACRNIHTDFYLSEILTHENFSIVTSFKAPFKTIYFLFNYCVEQGNYVNVLLTVKFRGNTARGEPPTLRIIFDVGLLLSSL